GAEALLGSDDVATCAQRALDWLGRAAGLTRGLCLVGDADNITLLRPVATLGLRGRRAASFIVDLDAGNDPLVAATIALEASVFGTNGRPAPPTPLEAGRLVAVPLHGRHTLEEYPVGLLLVAPPTADAETQARWVASLLGPRLTSLRAAQRREDGERRNLRERPLLYSIINALADRFLLTDPAGAIPVANARAEALLSAGEDESEGRRRAVALNNMLFSSALTRRAIEGAEPWRHELLLVDPVDGSDLLFELLSTVTVDPREGTGIVSILRNVTDLRRATQEIEENYRKLRVAETDARTERDRLDLIIDSVADPILVTDPNANIVM